MKIFFGTDGWRGILNEEINFESVALVAQAFADYLTIKKPHQLKAAVGFDGRKYSAEFAELFAEVLSGNGIETFLSDSVCPTPALSYFVKENILAAGVMITASHNPAKYNGIKFKADYGGPFLTEETLEVEKLLGRSAIKKNSDLIKRISLIPPYVEQLEEYIHFKSIREAKLLPCIDSMSGAGQTLLCDLLKKHGCSSKTIYGEPREDFSGRNAEPIEKNLRPLSEELQSGGYCFGIATDGDADRVGIMLETGEWLSAQETILLLSDYLITKKGLSGHIVKTSSVTDKVKNAFERNGRKVFDVQVGFKYICEKMITEEIAFGCEESGGYGYQAHMPERDGILSALLMLEMLARSGFSKLSEYAAIKRNEYGIIYYDRIDYTYEKENRIELLPQLYKNNLRKIAGFKVTDTAAFLSSRGIVNGLKYYLEGTSRWLLLRASETEPLVRVYAEGQSSEEVKQLLNTGISFFS